jgi:thiamine monophosphate synthase
VGTERVHLKATSAPADAIRAVLTTRFGAAWLTQGWHPADEEPPRAVDAVLVSPALAARKGRNPLGFVALGQAAARMSPVPVFALGGIGSNEAPALMTLPFAGIAVQAAWYTEPEQVLAALGIARTHG